MSQSPFPHLSGRSSFYKEGEGKRTKRSKEGVEVFYMQMSTVHSDEASDVLFASFWFSYYCNRV